MNTEKSTAWGYRGRDLYNMNISSIQELRYEPLKSVLGRLTRLW